MFASKPDDKMSYIEDTLRVAVCRLGDSKQFRLLV
jgi:hypothetical protein